jgi:hypothetical protein
VSTPVLGAVSGLPLRIASVAGIVFLAVAIKSEFKI